MVACADCTFVYVERDFPESYVNGYYEERAGGGYGLSQENFFWWHEATEFSNRHVLSLLGAANSRRMLEVGCGIGPFRPTPTRPAGRSAGWRSTPTGGNGYSMPNSGPSMRSSFRSRAALVILLATVVDSPS